LWPAFHRYARTSWPPAESAKISDAFQFCRHLKQQDAGAVATAEWNRLAFMLSTRRAAWHWVKRSANRGQSRHGLQLFIRGRDRRWRECFFYLGW